MNLKIVKNKAKFFAVSIILIAIGIGTMGLNISKHKGALNYDIEFTGGTAMTVDMGQPFNNDDVAKTVTKVTGQSSPQIQKILGTNEVSIKIQSVDGGTRTALADALMKDFALSDGSILKVQDISGTVSGEMQKVAVLAMIVACIAMLIYISIRFHDYKMGLSAIIALVHDVLIMISFYAVLRIPVNTAFIAAILTVVGYSINSTIVIFDRVRENKGLIGRNTLPEVIDISVWQTMRRSVYTSLTTLFTIGALYVFGVQSVKEFALPIIVGIISGVYSSVFISGSIWFMLKSKKGEKPLYKSEK
ncbi:MAG TPA: protein translocase subunit SecF [Lachnospiraceae bacterium]|nr:protein translocase subunit SecF [Lachnospiraceae bacterium]